MPIPWLAIAAVTAAGASMYGTYKTKPKTPTKPKSTYKANTKAMERYVSYLKGRRASRDVYRSAMEPALRNIGRSAAKTRSDISSQAVRTGLTGSGIEMQGKLSARQQELGALQDVSTQASTMQAQQNQTIGSEMAKASGQILSEEIRGENVVRAEENAWQARTDQHEQNLANWEGQMWQAGGKLLSSGISLAGDINKIYSTTSSAKAYADSAGGVGTYDSMIEQGFSDIDILNRYKGMEATTIKQMGDIDFGGALDHTSLDEMYNSLSGGAPDNETTTNETTTNEASFTPAPPVMPEVPVELEEEFTVSPVEYEDPDMPPNVRQAAATLDRKKPLFDRAVAPVEVAPDPTMDDFGNEIPSGDIGIKDADLPETVVSEQALAEISQKGNSEIIQKRVEGVGTKLEEAIRLNVRIQTLSRREVAALKKFGITVTGEETPDELVAIRYQVYDIVNNLRSLK